MFIINKNFFALEISKRDSNILIILNNQILIEFKFINDNLEYLKDFKIKKKDFSFTFSKYQIYNLF